MNDFIIEYLEKTKIPFITITNEFLDLINYKNTTLEQIITADLSSSFDQGFVIYYRECVTEEILLALHQFLRHTCCNIENIVLILSQGIGIKRFYDQYCKVCNTRGFHIIEAPYMYFMNHFITPESYKLGPLPKKQNIQSLFSYYGGTYERDQPERSILTLFASQYRDVAHIETMFDPPEWQKIENYLEYLTYFGNTDAINEYKNIFDTVVLNSKFNIPPLIPTDLSVPDERFTRQGPQWIIDSVSFASLIRETDNAETWYCLTEKTMRCFFHGVTPIPVHGKDVINDLEDLGFKFNKSFIDYSYLKEENLFYRLQKLKIELNKLQQLSFNDLHSLWLDNYEMFNYNSEYLLHSYKQNIIVLRLDDYFK